MHSKTLIFLVLVAEIGNICGTQSNPGTTLFYHRNYNTDCWNQEDLAKLRARMIFNKLLPQHTAPKKYSKRFFIDIMHYYRNALHTTDELGYSYTGNILKESLADAIGGHLRSELLPSARFAYYAGYVPYKQVRELHDFYDELKMFLNTQGLGWKRPTRFPELTNLTVIKIMIGPGRLFDPCSSLVVKRNSNGCILLQTPKVDDASDPSAIALPLKYGGLVNLVTPNSENMLLKYYTSAARCILRNSPNRCRHSAFDKFNNDLWHWMKRDVAPHLTNEKLYTAYGGVLRVAAAVQNYGKGLSRRNLFELQPYPIVNKWQPWKALSHSYLNVDTDWSPFICVALVVLAALVICFLQMLFNYMFGNADAGCQCVGPKKYISKAVEYSNIDSSFPAMLPQNDNGYDKIKGSRRTAVQTKPSTGTVMTQKVYDLNTEHFMNVIMSDAEETSSCSVSDSEYSNEEADKEADYVSQATDLPRSISPPKIETSIAQFKINKVGSGSSAARWAWSAGSSSPSGSSASSAPRSRPRPARDLAWARRVLDRNSTTKTTSGTELDHNSLTTPTSRR